LKVKEQNLKVVRGSKKMMKKTHVSVGVTLSSIIANLIGISITPMFIIATAIASILPDIDHPKGAINQKILLINNGMFKVITYVLFAALIMLYGPKYFDITVIYYTAPLFLVIAFSRHRGITHSLVGLAFVAMFSIFIKHKYGIDLVMAFVLGVGSHIFLDMFNPEGVELFWPCRKNYRFPVHFSTGGKIEAIVSYSFLIAVIYMFIGSNPHFINIFSKLYRFL
jgi:inner membrane protein